MHSRPALAALAALAAITLTSCSSEHTGPDPATSSPDRGVGGMVLQTGKVGQQEWSLTADYDDTKSLCMTFSTGPDGDRASRTCGLPAAAATGYQVVGVPGPGKSTFYYGFVAEDVASVQLEFAAGGTTTAETVPTPAQLGKAARFFVAQAPQGVAGAATVTLLDATGSSMTT